jgi:hypothetical protein
MNTFSRLIVPGLLALALAACTDSDRSVDSSGLASATITATQLAGMSKQSSISVSLAEDVKNLESLKGAAELEDLQILSSSLDSLEGIGSMSKLRSLFVQSSSLQSLKGLRSSTLKVLWVDASVLAELTDLAGVPQLEELHIFTNKPVNLEVLKQLPKLKKLWIQSTGKEELLSLSALAGLEELWISNDQFAQLASLDALTKLKHLTIRSANLRDITALSGRLNRLESLQLIATPIASLEPIGALSKLTHLGLIELSGKLTLTATQRRNLESLNVTGSTIDLAPEDTKGLTSLKSLLVDGSNVAVRNFEAPQLSFLTSNYTARTSQDFAAFRKLEVLGASNSGLTEITGLSGKTELSFADLSSNKISDLSPLGSSQKLLHLDVSSNGLASVNSLPVLNSVETIIAAANPFTDLFAFKQQPYLFELDLSNSNTNYEEIKKLFNRRIGEPRPLWLSLLRCKGVSIAESYTNCYEFVIPNGDSAAFFQQEAESWANSLDQQVEFLNSFDRVIAGGLNVDLSSCAWARNHIKLIEVFEQSFEAQKGYIKANFAWPEASVEALKTNLCGEALCDAAELQNIYKADLEAECDLSLDSPVTVERLSRDIRKVSQLEDGSPELQTIDYLGSVEEKTSGAFIAYLREMERKLRSFAERDANSTVSLRTERDQVLKGIQTTLLSTDRFLARCEKIRQQLQGSYDEIVKTLTPKVNAARKAIEP